MKTQMSQSLAQKVSLALANLLRNPFFLLIVGTLIGAILNPYLNERSNRHRLLQEARLKSAVAIVDNNSKTGSQLNAMATKLRMFHQDNIRLQPSPAKIKEAQDKLAEALNSSYFEFDKTGWWWYHDLADEATLLEVVPPAGSSKLRQDVNAYADNILATVTVVNELWHSCLAADYNYRDGRVAQIELDTQEKLSGLLFARKQLAGNLVSDFTEPH